MPDTNSPASAPLSETVASTQPKAEDLSPKACGALLAERFPALFGGPAKPLKLRIQADIQARAPGVFSKQTLSAFFRRYTGSNAYLSAMARSKQRFDLDGAPSGDLAEEHRKAAADELVRRRTSQDARRAEEEEGRRKRANLLRDFETTTLTAANFCGLKGITPADLETQLAQARRELEELKRQQPPPGRGAPANRPGGGAPPWRGRPDRTERTAFGGKPTGNSRAGQADNGRPGHPPDGRPEGRSNPRSVESRPPQHRRKPTGPRN